MHSYLWHTLLHWQAFKLRLFFEGIAVGLTAGACVALYRWLIALAEAERADFYKHFLTPSLLGGDFLFPLLWFAGLGCLALLLARLCRWEPMASGSGIPQVKGILRGLMRMHWARVLIVQILGGALAIGAGLSLGHAGPAVQIGAAAAQGVSRTAGRRRLEEHFLLASGAGAGLSAVFNAPLTGMLFVLEELQKGFSAAVLLPAMTAAISAAALIRLLFGEGTIFLFPEIEPLPAEHLPYVVLLAIAAGAAAVPFNYGLTHMDRFYGLPLFRGSRLWKISFALLLAGIFGFLFPPILGGGDGIVNAIVRDNPALPMLLLLLAGKVLFTLISFGSGVPGGFFFPSLVIGALVGSIVGTLLIGAGLLPPSYMTNIIMLTMTAFFSGSVRAPITGAVLLLEMTGSFSHLMAFAIASAVAYVTSGLLGGMPIYESLLQKQLRARGHGVEEKERHFMELPIGTGNPLAGKFIRDIHLPPHTVIVEIDRAGTPIVPDPATRLLAGDTLAILTQCGKVEEILNIMDDLDRASLDKKN